MIKNIILSLIIFFMASTSSLAQSANEFQLIDGLEIIEKDEYFIYLPEGIDLSKEHPLLVAISPNSEPMDMIHLWKTVADENQWIIFSEYFFEKGMNLGTEAVRVANNVRSVISSYNIKKSQIAVTGFDGGATLAHALSFYFPNVFKTIVMNAGEVSRFYKREDQLKLHPRELTAVFVVSPTDAKFDQFKEDYDLLKSLGWTVELITYEGGHKMPPEETMIEAGVELQVYWDYKRITK